MHPDTTLGPLASFPSLRTLAHTAQLRSVGINVFGNPGKKASLVLSIKDARATGITLQLEDVATAILGMLILLCVCVDGGCYCDDVGVIVMVCVAQSCFYLSFIHTPNMPHTCYTHTTPPHTHTTTPLPPNPTPP